VKESLESLIVAANNILYEKSENVCESGAEYKDSGNREEQKSGE